MGKKLTSNTELAASAKTSQKTPGPVKKAPAPRKTAAVRALETKLADRDARIAELETALKQKHKKFLFLQNEMWQNQVATSECRNIVERIEIESATYRKVIKEQKEALANSERRQQQLEQDLSKRDTEISYLKGEAGRRGDRIRILDEAFIREQRKASEINSRLDAEKASAGELKAQLETSQSHLEAEKSRAGELKAQLEASQSSLEAKTVELETLEAQLISTENELRQRQHECDQTAGQLEESRAALKTALQQHDEAREHGKAELGTIKHQLDVVREKLDHERKEAQAQLATVQRERDAAHEKLDVSFEEITRLANVLAATQTRQAELESDIGTLRPLVEILRNMKSGAGAQKGLPAQIQSMIAILLAQCERPYLTRRIIERRQAALLRATGILDAEWYRAHNADIGQAGVSAETHFILFGNTEGRAPNNLIQTLLDQETPDS